ncbi:hypothetical protein ABIB27_001303 [Arthrobacter sp. UYEF21]
MLGEVAAHEGVDAGHAAVDGRDQAARRKICGWTTSCKTFVLSDIETANDTLSRAGDT